MTNPLVAPIECLIAYHEKYAKDHVSSRWIYGENMMVVQAYKKVLRMIDELEREAPPAPTPREADDVTQFKRIAQGNHHECPEICDCACHKLFGERAAGQTSSEALREGQEVWVKGVLQRRQDIGDIEGYLVMLHDEEEVQWFIREAIEGRAALGQTSTHEENKHD